VKDQFVGKPFWIVLGCLASCFGFAVLVFDTPFAGVSLALVTIGVFMLTVKRLEWGLAAAFAELFANSHGHLISTPILGLDFSLRMGVFCAVMAGWLVLVICQKAPLPFRDSRLTPFFALGAAVAVGFAIGATQNNSLDAFKDGNAYFYAAYVMPILSVRWGTVERRLLLHTLAASALWVVIMSLGTLYLFTHASGEFLVPVYKFMRDTRTAEMTQMVGWIFRIFLQAQISVVFFWLIVSPLLWSKQISRRQMLGLTSALSLGTAIVIMSLSRSFWMAVIASGIVFSVLIMYAFRPTIKQSVRAFALHLVTIPIGAAILIAVALFPIPYRGGAIWDLASLLSSRATETGDVAISSRWELLGPLWDEVKASPIAGSGFGQTVTFKTNDPRARAVSPDGTWTTYSLEWGWLDLWLKMGILGPLAFLVLFIASVRGLWPMIAGDRAWLGVGLIASLVMLYVTNIFSPYLNHPLGIGFLLFLVPFMQTKASAFAEAKSVELKPTVQASTAALTSE